MFGKAKETLPTKPTKCCGSWYIAGAVGAQQKKLLCVWGTQAEDPRGSAGSAESGRMRRNTSHRCRRKGIAGREQQVHIPEVGQHDTYRELFLLHF